MHQSTTFSPAFATIQPLVDCLWEATAGKQSDGRILAQIACPSEAPPAGEGQRGERDLAKLFIYGALGVKY